MSTRVILSFGLIVLLAAGTVIAQRGQQAPVTIRAARVLDGRGGVLSNAVVAVQGSKIVSVGPADGPVTYDLGNATILPGRMAVQVHLNWYCGPTGKYGEGNLRMGYAQEAIVANARATLMAGFTTVQSLGTQSDR